MAPWAFSSHRDLAVSRRYRVENDSVRVCFAGPGGKPGHADPAVPRGGRPASQLRVRAADGAGAGRTHLQTHVQELPRHGAQLLRRGTWSVWHFPSPVSPINCKTAGGVRWRKKKQCPETIVLFFAGHVLSYM